MADPHNETFTNDRWVGGEKIDPLGSRCEERQLDDANYEPETLFHIEIG